MSRYDDPRWYEEQHGNSMPPQPPAYDDLNQLPPPPAQPGGMPGFPYAPYNPYQQQPGVPQAGHQRPKRRNLGRIFAQALTLVALVVLAFFGGWFAHQLFGNSFSTPSSTDSRAYSNLIQQAWNVIDQHYVDRKAVNYKDMSYSAIRSMVDSLKDRGHTRFMTPQEVQSENQQLSGKFIGIGIYLHQDPKTKDLSIASTIPGAPAEGAGLKRGDILLSVNGQDVRGKDTTTVSQLIKGDAGTSVTIKVQRPGQNQPLTFKIERKEINVPSVIMHYIPEEHVAHIQIVQFTNGVSDQLRTALQQAKDKGAKKYILDLRDNPGGYLNEATQIASMFVKSGNVLIEKNSTGQETPVPVTGNTIDTQSTLVVLVNANSASAAEIVTAALKDNNRAFVIGDPHTFGTGTVLQQYSLSDGSAILLGVQEWLTPKGKFIRDNGVEPNQVVKLPGSGAPLTPADENSGNYSLQKILGSSDTQLIAALKYLQNH
ncbi:S41 family peptidase [Ktedonobacter racemifer]|uniref:Carboxyl-terminal protease n=1 Tax=Ktedonobacter racemifer DSM 44963 TaxID=485913 RepID=D6TPH5_KTERA|nr:S41 family peptidase [Ktedonobacter racemifer]EFH85589.1 carboxyl-terminal protease [Ktedonobacter racemifer DSM 44963]